MTLPEGWKTERQVATERRRLKVAIAELIQAWAQLESAFAFFLALMIAKPNAEQACMNLFFSASNLETRIRMIDVAISSLTKKGTWHDIVIKEWVTIQNSLNGSKNLRNEVVHGLRVDVFDPNGATPRVIAPLFNNNRLFDRKTGLPRPGQGINEILNSTDSIYTNIDKIMLLAVSWEHIENDNEKALRERLAALQGRRPTKRPPQDAPTPPKQKRQRRSSPE